MRCLAVGLINLGFTNTKLIQEKTINGDQLVPYCGYAADLINWSFPIPNSYKKVIGTPLVSYCAFAAEFDQSNTKLFPIPNSYQKINGNQLVPYCGSVVT